MPTSLSSSLQKLTSELNLFWFYGYCDQTCSNVKPVVPCKWFPVRGFMSLLRQCLSVWSLKQQFYGVCGLAGPPIKRKYSRRKNWESISYSPREPMVIPAQCPCWHHCFWLLFSLSRSHPCGQTLAEHRAVATTYRRRPPAECRTTPGPSTIASTTWNLSIGEVGEIGWEMGSWTYSSWTIVEP